MARQDSIKRRYGHVSLVVAVALSVMAGTFVYAPMRPAAARDASMHASRSRASGEALLHAAILDTRSVQGQRIADSVVARVHRSNERIFDELQKAAYQRDRPAVALVLTEVLRVAQATSMAQTADCVAVVHGEPLRDPMLFYVLGGAEGRLTSRSALRGSNLAVEHLANRIVEIAAE